MEVRSYDKIQKRTRNTIVRHLENLEEKYGENAVRLVVNRWYHNRNDRRNAMRQKARLERELEELDKKL